MFIGELIFEGALISGAVICHLATTAMQFLLLQLYVCICPLIDSLFYCIIKCPPRRCGPVEDTCSFKASQWSRARNKEQVILIIIKHKYMLEK